MEYPKINSIWKRDETHEFIEGDYSCQEFSAFKTWRVEEKIDGTNVRVYIQNGKIEIKGKTDNSQLPTKLISFFNQDEFMSKVCCFGQKPVELFGEGFGAGIQLGGIYRPDIAFILFDVYMNGRWGQREEVYDVASKLGLEHPADLGMMTEEEIITFVKSKPKGRYNSNNYTMEGVIARSEPLVRFNDHGNPVVWKLKVKDFKRSGYKNHE